MFEVVSLVDVELVCGETWKLALLPHVAAPAQAQVALGEEAPPVLLEPVMKVEVSTPEENMGDVIGDLNSRRGMVSGMEDSPAGRIVKAEVPLAEMFGYATDLRGATQGRASYSMEFEKYQEVPAAIADGIINRF